MKHAGFRALENLDALLQKLRERETLDERTPGSFYLRSKAFLHFHEDPAGLFADLKEDLVTFKRFRVSTKAERAGLLSRVDRCLKRLAVSSYKKNAVIVRRRTL
jgi:hypothetical protein